MPDLATRFQGTTDAFYETAGTTAAAATPRPPPTLQCSSRACQSRVVWVCASSGWNSLKTERVCVCVCVSCGLLISLFEQTVDRYLQPESFRQPSFFLHPRILFAPPSSSHAHLPSQRSLTTVTLTLNPRLATVDRTTTHRALVIRPPSRSDTARDTRIQLLLTTCSLTCRSQALLNNHILPARRPFISSIFPPSPTVILHTLSP